MTELRELYQEVILDHYKRPRNQQRPEGANHMAVGHNPLCGDKITVFLSLDGDGIVRDIGFEGSGCAISTASASMMTEIVKGKPVSQAQAIFERFHDLVTGQEEPDVDGLGKLAAFAGVREFPVRVKCASLAWHTFKAALEDKTGQVTTE
ncbi:MAG: SUF system NifU family Fe-S cluster assembly protein [Pseudomonadota bacterium]